MLGVGGRGAGAGLPGSRRENALVSGCPSKGQNVLPCPSGLLTEAAWAWGGLIQVYSPEQLTGCRAGHVLQPISWEEAMQFWGWAKMGPGEERWGCHLKSPG